MRVFGNALLAVWAALGVELAIVVALHHAELTTAWELAMGTVWLAPAALVAATPGALVAGFILHGLSRGTAVWGRVLATLFGIACGVVAALVTTGRHFEASGVRASVVIVVTLVGVAVARGVVPRVARLLAENRGRFAAVFVAVACLLEVVNAAVLLRLYPPFHAALALGTLVAAGVAGAAREERTPVQRVPVIFAATLGALAGAVLLARPAAAELSRFDNYRLFASEHAPVLGLAVRVAATLAPPPPLGALDPCALDPNACVASGNSGVGPNLAGRDIVLLTVDALRADHVGAYGYARATTPNIDALARESVVFDAAYCPTPNTSYSVTSLMTGKYIRPLLLQGTGSDSRTLATFLRTYGYKTAGFYPPAVFFIDEARFEPFEKSHLGFEYRKVEFLEGEGRVKQVAAYLGRQPNEQRLFLWVHLFGPHEPYEAHPDHPFGDRDVDRYDSEIAAADEAVGSIVRVVREARPNAVVIVTADHGEAFGEHGSRYHGTTVYEEQVRVPLLISAPKALAPRRLHEVVQTIDILPTILAALAIPPSPRVRGRNLGPLLVGSRAEQPGFAFAETDDDTLLAEGSSRLLCARKLGACRLYDLVKDPGEQSAAPNEDSERFGRMRSELEAFEASHGRFELRGLRDETGRGWPPPILRAMAGDADVATDLAALLDDSDRDIRRKVAELLFNLKRPETVPALRLALGRDEDTTVQRWCALALTRLGETVPLTTDLAQSSDLAWSRRAALALAEAGDGRGEDTLIDWWQHGAKGDNQTALELLGAFAKIRSKKVVWPLVQSLGDVRLRPRIASTLASIGDGIARGPLIAALLDERHQTARVAIADALVALGAKEELARPLIRFLGVPDPLPGGVGYAERAGVLGLIGGPDAKGLGALQRQGNDGVRIQVVVPKTGNGTGVRVVIRASAQGQPGQVRIGRSLEPTLYDSKGELINRREAPRIHDRDFTAITVPVSQTPIEVTGLLPGSLGVAPGRSVDLIVFAERNVRLEALALVPLSDELPPPPPAPWTPSNDDGEQ